MPGFGDGAAKARRSFLKKRTKKLLIPVGRSPAGTATARAKAFCFFFSKKKALPCLVSLLSLAALTAQAAAPPAPAWFVPPPPNASSLAEGPHVDISKVANTETIVVRAKKKPIQRDPHGEEDHAFQPLRSEATGPQQTLPNQSYCQSAYQTVGGQAATGQDLIGSAAGHCD